MTAAAQPIADALPPGIADLLTSLRVEIDGVQYVACDFATMDWEHKNYLEVIFLEAGLEDPGQFMSRGAAWQQNAKQILLALYRSKRQFALVAGSLVAEGQEWSEPDARVLALRLAKLKDNAIIERLQQLIALFVANFFMRGRDSFGTSPSASAKTTAPSAPDPNAAPFDSAATAPLSADSQATIQTG